MDTELDRLQRALAVVDRRQRKTWWRRLGSKERGFRCVAADGARVTDEAALERIRALAIPPAWHHVRISPSARSRLQAIGIDTSGRPQYIYHASFAARRQRDKYERIRRFGERLPALRRIADEDIQRDGFPKERVLAIVVRLIGELFFRVGSEEHTRRYRTYGITTLRNRHLTIGSDGALVFDFDGKRHIRQRRVLVDPELADVLRRLKALGGPRLFEYVGEDGRVHPVSAGDVNAYIKAALGGEFSAKDFRTWAGTVLTAAALAEVGPVETETQRKRVVTHVVKRVAERLGNTPTICRGCYIHPRVIERYEQGVTLEEFRPRRRRRIAYHQGGHDPEEAAVLAMLGDAQSSA